MILAPPPAMAAVGELTRWALGRRERFRVSGPSMAPTLRPGEFVLVDRGQRPGPGALALARHPAQPDVNVVKRVARVEPDGRYVLASDNPGEGTDSRHWGPVAPEAVLGRVTLVLDRPAAPLGRPRSEPAPGQRPRARWLRR